MFFASAYRHAPDAPTLEPGIVKRFCVIRFKRSKAAVVGHLGFSSSRQFPSPHLPAPGSIGGEINGRPVARPVRHNIFVVARYDHAQVAAFGVDQVDLAVRLVVMVEGDPFAVGRPARSTGKALVEEAYLQRVIPIPIASPYLVSSGAAGLENDLLSVRGQLRRVVFAIGSDDRILRNNLSACAGERHTRDHHRPVIKTRDISVSQASTVARQCSCSWIHGFRLNRAPGCRDAPNPAKSTSSRVEDNVLSV